MSEFTGVWEFLNQILYIVPKFAKMEVCEDDENRLHIEFNSGSGYLVLVDGPARGRVLFQFEHSTNPVSPPLMAFASMLVGHYCRIKVIEQGGNPNSVRVSGDEPVLDWKYDNSFKAQPLTFDQLADQGSKPVSMDDMLEHAGVEFVSDKN